MNTTHYPTNNGASSLASQQLVTALLSVAHDWFQALEAGQEVCSIFFDLRKAFDSVPHRPLVDKLDNLGLDAHALSWITSYLTSGKQHVLVGGEQWRSQDIAVARAQHGHTTFVRTSAQNAEAYRGARGHPPPENLGILQPLRSVLRPYTVAKCKSLTANSRMMSV